MVTLLPMTALEYDEYVRISIAGYAESKTRAGIWAPSVALEESRREFDKILPQARATPGHHFFTIRREDGERVGSLWLAVPPARGPRGAYIYELSVDEGHRRRGYAEGAMRAAETIALAKGEEILELNVFGFNDGAQALYAKLGYEVVATYMRKNLRPNAPSPVPSAT